MYGPASTLNVERYVARLGIRDDRLQRGDVQASHRAARVDDVQAVVGPGKQAQGAGRWRGRIGRLLDQVETDRRLPGGGVVRGAGFLQDLAGGPTRRHTLTRRPLRARTARRAGIALGGDLLPRRRRWRGAKRHVARRVVARAEVRHGVVGHVRHTRAPLAAPRWRAAGRTLNALHALYALGSLHALRTGRPLAALIPLRALRTSRALRAGPRWRDVRHERRRGRGAQRLQWRGRRGLVRVERRRLGHGYSIAAVIATSTLPAWTTTSDTRSPGNRLPRSGGYVLNAPLLPAARVGRCAGLVHMLVPFLRTSRMVAVPPETDAAATTIRMTPAAHAQ